MRFFLILLPLCSSADPHLTTPSISRSGVTWGDQTLFDYLLNPKKVRYSPLSFYPPANLRIRISHITFNLILTETPCLKPHSTSLRPPWTSLVSSPPKTALTSSLTSRRPPLSKSFLFNLGSGLNSLAMALNSHFFVSHSLQCPWTNKTLPQDGTQYFGMNPFWHLLAFKKRTGQNGNVMNKFRTGILASGQSLLYSRPGEVPLFESNYLKRCYKASHTLFQGQEHAREIGEIKLLVSPILGLLKSLIPCYNIIFSQYVPFNTFTHSWKRPQRQNYLVF